MTIESGKRIQRLQEVLQDSIRTYGMAETLIAVYRAIDTTNDYIAAEKSERANRLQLQLAAEADWWAYERCAEREREAARQLLNRHAACTPRGCKAGASASTSAGLAVLLSECSALNTIGREFLKGVL